MFNELALSMHLHNHITNSVRFIVPWSLLTVPLPGLYCRQMSSAPGVGYTLSHSIHLTFIIVMHYAYYGILFQKFIRHFTSSALMFACRCACCSLIGWERYFPDAGVLVLWRHDFKQSDIHNDDLQLEKQWN